MNSWQKTPARRLSATLLGAAFVGALGATSANALTIYTETPNVTVTNLSGVYNGEAGNWTEAMQVNIGQAVGHATGVTYDLVQYYSTSAATYEYVDVKHCNIFGCTITVVAQPVPGYYYNNRQTFEVEFSGSYLGEITDTPGLPGTSEAFYGTPKYAYCPGDNDIAIECNYREHILGYPPVYVAVPGGGSGLELNNLVGTEYLHLKFDIAGTDYLGTATLTRNGDSLTLSKVQYASEADLAAAAVPEPATWALMIAGFGLAGVGLRARRRLRLA